MRSLHRQGVALALAWGMLALAACGDDEPGSPASASTPPPPPGADASATPPPTPEPPPPPPPGLPPPTPPTGIIAFERITSVELDAPIELVVHDGKRYVVEQGGRVRLLSSDGASASTVLDVAGEIVGGGEAGLLGLAFHPDFATNGFAFVYFTVPHPTVPKPAGVEFQSALVRYHSADDGLTFEPGSATRILTVDQPYSNHNGATIAFGNDGFLYWGLGDGGSGGDPDEHAQNPDSLLGKMLRLDVDSADPYAIPPDNPYASSGGRPEIFASGLRNPYRFRFDRTTGALWAGDVGQEAREEIDKITLGGNYGWNLREGKICYPAQSPCSSDGFIDPVVDHGRNDATTITGGEVYRGSGVPAIAGKYVYGDFGTQTYWAIPIDEAAPTAVRLDDGANRPLPAAFALDTDGELLVLDFGGAVWRVTAGTNQTAR